MSNDNLHRQIESMTVGPDDTFRFHCDQCGGCCTHREDIILSPMDIFRISKELKMTPADFYKQYCVFNIGDHTRMPIVRLASVGKDQRCILLKNSKCSVHKVKPAVCAMFPLGRYIALDKGDYTKEAIANSKVQYLMQPLDCGDDSEEHTVREWLNGFDIHLEDEAFIKWHQTIAQYEKKIRQLEKTQDMMTMMEIWQIIRVILYLAYDTSKEFLPQFEFNSEKLLKLLDDIPALKRMVYHGR